MIKYIKNKKYDQKNMIKIYILFLKNKLYPIIFKVFFFFFFILKFKNHFLINY